jgi:hypothetical protein
MPDSFVLRRGVAVDVVMIAIGMTRDIVLAGVAFSCPWFYTELTILVAFYGNTPER